jgi:hypothetical protein
MYSCRRLGKLVGIHNNGERLATPGGAVFPPFCFTGELGWVKPSKTATNAFLPCPRYLLIPSGLDQKDKHIISCSKGIPCSIISTLLSEFSVLYITHCHRYFWILKIIGFLLILLLAASPVSPVWRQEEQPQNSGWSGVLGLGLAGCSSVCKRKHRQMGKAHFLKAFAKSSLGAAKPARIWIRFPGWGQFVPLKLRF